MIYNIKRKAGNLEQLLKAVKPTGTQSPEAMGADVVDMAFSLPEYIDFRIGDYVDVYGQRYVINVMPSVEKKGKREFEYNIQFEAIWYDLAKVQYQFLNPANNLLEPVFDLMGNAATFIGLLVQNANRHSPGWSVGVVDDTAYINKKFSSQNCLQVLHDLATQFETEFWIDNKTIHLQKREQASGVTFEYGKGNGLYNIKRSNKSNTNILTRLYVRGGTSNLPTGYGSNSLLLPNKATYIQDDTKVALYGLIEATQIFENIFPQREGTVTGVVSGDENWRYFTDNTVDFNISASPGLDAKVTFNTGQLAGYTFTINNFNPATKQFSINKNTDETALDIPSKLLRPKVGDKYVLIDIIMPDAYVVTEENKLFATARAYYTENSDPKFLLAYSATCNPLFIRQHNISVVLGSTAVLHDGDLGINTELRISKYSRDLQNPDLYSNLEWSDTLGANEIVRQYQQQKKTLQMIESCGLLDANQMRKNIFLNRLSENDGYLMLGGNKVKAGVADYTPEAGHALNADYAKDSDKWDGYHFADYLNQPVRKTDAVTFLSVVADTVNSRNYVSGVTGSGYKINPDGSAEFDSVTIRKELNVNILNVREITGSGGSLAITNVAKIKEVFDNGTFWSCTINTDDNTIAVQFKVDDIVRCQVWDGKKLKFYTARVKDVSASTFDLYKANKTGSGIPDPGDSVFQFGNTTDVNRQGLIYLTNSDNTAPYLDVLDGINSESLAGKTKVRLGKLSGIYDADLGQLDGYGIYAERAFIKGKIVVTGGNAETIQGAQNKANAAQTNAISAASGDATTKANNAQAAAIQIASGDAQTKADAAKAAASALAAQLVNDIKIGGRNLLQSSKSILLSGTDYPGNQNVYFQSPTDGYRISIPNANNFNAYASVSHLAGLIQGNTYTLTVYYRRWQDNADHLNVRMIAYPDQTGVNLPYTAGKWSSASLQFVYAGFVVLVLGGYSQGGDMVDYLAFKIEEGNKSTDWTPAPEEVQQAIDVAKAAADQANTSYNTLTASLKGMAYQDVVELSKLGSTVIENGMIKTTLLDAGYIRSNVVNAGYINTLNLDASAIKSGTIDSARINAGQIVISGGGATTGQLQTAKNEATQQISNVTIGGRNLIKGFAQNTPLNVVSTNFYTEWYFNAPLQPNTEYVFSYDCQVNSGDPAILRTGLGIGNLNNYSADLITWVDCNLLTGVFKFKTGPVLNYPYFQWRPWLQVGNPGLLINVDFWNIKLEKGNKKTDWSPNPDDVQQGINTAKSAADQANAAYANLVGSLKSMAYQDVVELAKMGSTVIENGMIKTSLINADYIKSNIVNAGYINTLSLDASAIKSGQISADRIDTNNLVAVKLAATSGTIAGFTIEGQYLRYGQPFTANQNFVSIAPGSFIYRRIKQDADHIIEATLNGIPASAGYEVGGSFVHTASDNAPNIALSLKAQNSGQNVNIALDILAGDIRVGGSIGITTDWFAGSGSKFLYIRKGIIVGAT